MTTLTPSTALTDHFVPITTQPEPSPSQGNATNRSASLDLALTIARAADDRKGGEITILQVTEVSYLADYFVLVTGYSKPQVRTMAQAIIAAAEAELQRTPRRVEGLSEATWVLVDYGDVIVHILLPREREFYNLEAFWGHADRIPFLSGSAT